MKLVIFDIDGTLADCSNRIHHLTKKPKDWDAFFAGMDRDPPNEPVVEVCRAMYARGYRIVLCTGRFERDRALTEGWLHGNQVPFHEIRMRRDDDKRSDTETKREMIRPSEKEHILFVIEDRGRIAEMWRDMGLVCLQCAKGDF